jgi:two-component system response regulator WspF
MRIGIVNDMPLAREALRRVVLTVPEHQIAWLAPGGAEAIEHARCDRPDLILMDLIMPGIDGAETTRRIMTESPCPILVVTASVDVHMGKVYDAMGHGALDAVDTPALGPRGEITGASALLDKIATIGKLIGKIPFRTVAPTNHAARVRAAAPGEFLVAIGSSTGGPNALSEILSTWPKNWNVPAVLIQHVDSAFASGLANWLGERCGLRTELIREGERPQPGRVFLAATNDHLVLDRDRRFRYVVEPREMSYRPSVDVFFSSLLAHWPTPGVAVLLTGMGRDGAAGLLALKRSGWHTIAQDESTSVVWGMPKAAVELGAAGQVLPVSAIGPAVVEEIRIRQRKGDHGL